MQQMSRKAFTLIELLIVVAIIAILAAIAVPNFLEAQTRSKVSRTKADMRTIATAMEAYHVDTNRYPSCNSFGTALAINRASSNKNQYSLVLENLSTPVSYLTNALVRDPFLLTSRRSGASSAAMVASAAIPVSPETDTAARLNTYIYQAYGSDYRAQFVTDSFTPELQPANRWFLHSVGPDGNYYNLGGVMANERTADEGPILLIYDPTNGTVSQGSVFRTGGATGGATVNARGEGLAQAINSSQ